MDWLITGRKKLQRSKVREIMGCFQTRLMWGSLGIWSSFQKNDCDIAEFLLTKINTKVMGQSVFI